MSSAAVGQDGPPPDAPSDVSADAIVSCPGCTVIPPLTSIRVEMLTALGSKISKTGDTFPIRLAEPIMVDGKMVVPAGAQGMGEVIHAKKGGGSGSGGELVLAARYLDIGGLKLHLRSLRMTAANGRSRTGTVDTLAIASAASPLPIGFIGLFIKGGETTIPEGTIADAKTAEALSVPSPTPTIQPASK